ncbi:MAG: hypothetical protein AB8F34_11065 [Akkermansiaceae bacterium]
MKTLLISDSLVFSCVVLLLAEDKHPADANSWKQFVGKTGASGWGIIWFENPAK